MKFSLNESIAVLERTPTVLKAQLEGLTDDWLMQTYGSNTWSVHQVIGHLIWGERTDWVPRIKHILHLGETESFVPFDRDGHAQLCKDSNTTELIEIFAGDRSRNLAELKQLELTDADLEKTGIHPALGNVNLTQLIATWTVHDLNHVAQINKAMAFQYSDSVGPWMQYLSILAPPNPR